MNADQWLLLITAALAFYGVGNVWLVQLSSYKLWPYVGRGEFRAYHLVWWHSIWGVILFPAGIVFVASIAMLWMRPADVPRSAVWLAFGLQLALCVLTAAWWGPLMARLETPQGALSLPRYRSLMRSHWLRVGIVTVYGVLIFWMLARHVFLTR